MSETEQGFHQKGLTTEFLKLNAVKMKNRMRNVYSSVSHSRSNTIKSQRTRFNSLDRENKTNSVLTKWAVERNDNTLFSEIIPKIRKIQMNKINTQIDIIKECSIKILEDNSRANRMELSETLLKLHPFFSKINKTISQAIVLLSKPKKYYKGQFLIEQQCNSAEKNSSKRQKQKIGFILYGKVELSNDKYFYSHNMKNSGTLYEDKFLGRSDKIKYKVNVKDETMVLWLSRQSYYIIRRECFLSLDLKYMFGEFENMLKYNLIHKNLLEEPK